MSVFLCIFLVSAEIGGIYIYIDVIFLTSRCIKRALIHSLRSMYTIQYRIVPYRIIARSRRIKRSPTDRVEELRACRRAARRVDEIEEIEIRDGRFPKSKKSKISKSGWIPSFRRWGRNRGEKRTRMGGGRAHSNYSNYSSRGTMVMVITSPPAFHTQVGPFPKKKKKKKWYASHACACASSRKRQGNRDGRRREWARISRICPKLELELTQIASYRKWGKDRR